MNVHISEVDKMHDPKSSLALMLANDSIISNTVLGQSYSPFAEELAGLIVNGEVTNATGHDIIAGNNALVPINSKIEVKSTACLMNKCRRIPFPKSKDSSDYLMIVYPNQQGTQTKVAIIPTKVVLSDFIFAFGDHTKPAERQIWWRTELDYVSNYTNHTSDSHGWRSTNNYHIVTRHLIDNDIVEDKVKLIYSRLNMV
jgi:hypothetical protein